MVALDISMLPPAEVVLIAKDTPSAVVAAL